MSGFCGDWRDRWNLDFPIIASWIVFAKGLLSRPDPCVCHRSCQNDFLTSVVVLRLLHTWTCSVIDLYLSRSSYKLAQNRRCRCIRSTTVIRRRYTAIRLWRCTMAKFHDLADAWNPEVARRDDPAEACAHNLAWSHDYMALRFECNTSYFHLISYP